MKLFNISNNNDTYTGMRLAGIDGCICHDEEELEKALSDVVKDKDIGIVLLTEKFSLLYPDLVNKYKTTYKLPLFVDIPDRFGTGRKKDFITSHINEVIGLKL